MANYTGVKCEYCHKAFTESDDIVVCPQCGSPYHRECYETAGECINHELHEKGVSWTAQTDEQKDAGESIRCPRCGQDNPSMGIFCNKCGMPLRFDAGQRPFNNGEQKENDRNTGAFGQQGPFGTPFGGQGATNFFGQEINRDTVIDGNTIAEYVDFTGSNSPYFLLQFMRFAKTSVKFSINLMAMICTEFYFFYRKMYKQGILAFCLILLLSVPYVMSLLGSGMIPNVSMPDFMKNNIEEVNFVLNACSFVTFFLRVFFGSMANYWYFKKAKKTLEKIKSEETDEEVIRQKTVELGGTSAPALIISLTAYFAAVIGILMLAISL